MPVKVLSAAPAEWPAHLKPPGSREPREKPWEAKRVHKAGPGRPPGGRNRLVKCVCGHCKTCWNREWKRRDSERRRKGA